MNKFYKNLIHFFKDTILNEKTSFKEKILTVLDFIFKKIPLLIVISTFILYFFDDQIAGFLNEQLVNPYLHLIKKENISDNAIYCFIGILILFWVSKYLRRYIYSNKAISLYTYAFIVYVCYRIFSDKWTFLYFKWEIAYLDIIALIYIAVLVGAVYKSISFIKNYKKVIEGPALLLGEEIEKREDDLLDYDHMSEQIANKISSLNNKKSFAVGITKKWGNGKTSFINLLRENLKDKNKDAIIIDFCPWFCKTEVDIISLFFNTLSDKLKPYHSSLNNQILKYAKLITSVKVSGVLFKVNQESTIKQLYNQIDKSIASINRKIYIIIDDVDRLQPNEIIECLKIIRNTANFQKIVFIVAYDPLYVDRAIRKSLSNNTKGYMDKIIQLPFELPEIEDNVLIDYISDTLKEDGISEDTISSILLHKYYALPKKIFLNRPEKGYSKELNIKNYFSNIRDCNKVLNIFFTYKNILRNEVELNDLFLICILKTIFPHEAVKIYNDLNHYYDGNNFKFIPEEKAEGKNHSVPLYRIKNLNNKPEFIDIICAIFLKKEKTIKSAALNYNYYTYYNGLIPSYFISYDKLIEGLKSITSLLNLIDNVEENKRPNLINRLLKLNQKDTKDRIIIISGLLYLLDEKFSNTNQNHKAYLSIYDVIKHVKQYENDIISLLKEIIKIGPVKILPKIALLLEEIKYPYLTNNKIEIILNKGIINAEEDFESHLKKDHTKFHSLIISVLEKAIFQQLTFQEIYQIYKLCYDKIDNHIRFIDKKATYIFNDYINSNKIEFMKNLQIISNEGSKFIDQLDICFFNKIGDFTGFEKFMNETIKDNPNLHELNEIKKEWFIYKKNYRSHLGIDEYENSIANKEHA